MAAYSTMPTMRKINKLDKDFTAMSFFSGCGGSSTGYKLAGFNVLYANEFIEEAVNTYKANHINTFVDDRDIRKIDPKKIMRQLNIKPKELDLLDGSPPCSPFSSAGTFDKGWGKVKKYSDSEQRTDDLFFEYIRMINAIQPKVFIAENVPGLASTKARHILSDIVTKIKDCGYSVKVMILDAAELDVPQYRKRLIFIGVRNDIVKLGFKPEFPKSRGYKINVKDVLPDIIGLRSVSQGQFIDANRPMYTITASDGVASMTAKFSSGAYVETKTGEQRKLTVPELKILSTFPKDFKLTGTYKQQVERIGRAVPPMMSYHIAHTIREKILEPYYSKIA